MLNSRMGARASLVLALAAVIVLGTICVVDFGPRWIWIGGIVGLALGVASFATAVVVLSRAKTSWPPVLALCLATPAIGLAPFITAFSSIAAEYAPETWRGWGTDDYSDRRR